MTLAAYDLHVSQSTISSAIGQLEKDLGVQLFIRHHPKGISLSDAGLKFYEELKEFLIHANELAAGVKSLGNNLAGELSLGFFSILSPFYLPLLLDEFEKICPQVNARITEGNIEGLVEKLRDGAIELAVTYNIDLPHDIDYKILTKVKPYVLISAEHRLAQRYPHTIPLVELVNDPYILLDLPHSRDYFINLFKHIGYFPNISHKTPSFETVRSLVAQNKGFALLNQKSHTNFTYDGGKTINLDIEENFPYLELVLAKLKTVKFSRKAVLFQEICHKSFRLQNSCASKISLPQQ